MIFVFDTKRPVEMLPLQFRHKLLGLANASSPRHVMGVWSHFVKVFEVEADDVAVQFFQACHRIKAGTHPMTDVRARAHQGRATLDRRQNEIRIPVNRMTFGMIMDGDLDVVFLAKFFHGVQSIGFRLGHERVNTPFLGELEYFPALHLIGRQLDDADVDEGPTDAGGNHLGLDRLHVLVGEGDGADGFGILVKQDASRKAHVFDSQRGGFVNGVKDGEQPERVGMNRELPAGFVGGTGVG